MEGGGGGGGGGGRRLLEAQTTQPKPVTKVFITLFAH